jgi:hypothetical protein
VTVCFHSLFVQQSHFDYETKKYVTSKITKLIVIIAESETGFVQIRLDPPSIVHEHKDIKSGKSTKRAYLGYYFKKASELLGDKGFEPFDLTGVALKLVSAEPPIILLPHGELRTSSNSKFKYSSQVDVREDPAYQAILEQDGKGLVQEDLSCFFLPDQSGGKIERKVYTRLVRRDSMISVSADCLAEEVDYVLSRIRETRN